MNSSSDKPIHTGSQRRVALPIARRRRSSSAGKSMMFLCAGALSVCLLLLFGLIGILTWHGMGHFWPSPLELFTLQSGEQFLAERQGRRIDRGQSLVEASEDAAKRYELYLKLGNRDVYPTSFRWVAESEIARVETPEDVVVCERYSNGVFYGRIRQIRKDEVVLADGQAASLAWMRDWLPDILASKEAAESSSSSEAAVLELVDGRVVQGTEPLTEIYRIYEPNRMGLGERVEHFLLELWDFVTESPRHANTEGGIFPAIFGTVLMVFLMTVFVTPFGVLAALYLREYAKQGPFVSFIRIAVNNLAGVPSIVFGLFGLGFFVYFVGGGIDELFFPHRGNSPTFGTGGLLWASLTLALLTLPVVIVATEEGLASVPGEVRTGSLALGATKWETIWRVVLPAASPGILTGLILAIARAAGEVAPLMIVGMAESADLPVDGEFPFVHLEAKFMHLGYHIYNLGFRSSNAEATRPLVYATALLLILLVALMNVVAILLRNHLRAKYATNTVE